MPDFIEEGMIRMSTSEHDAERRHPLTADERKILNDIIKKCADRGNPNPLNEEDRKQFNEILERKCSDRERDILRMRFGLTDGKMHTLEETAQVFEVSRERVRQIESKALNRLFRPSHARAKKIADFYK